MSFANIFSRKKEPRKNKQIIQVDNRERNSLVPSELMAAGFEIEWKQLPVADYLVNNIAIERKTVPDLKTSIINKRIFNQLIQLQQYPQSLLLIEGVDEMLYQEILHENAVRGFLLSTAMKNKIPFVYTRDEKDTAKFIQVLANKRPETTQSIRPQKTILSDKQRLIFILEGFPNIGPVTARKLLDKFKTLQNIMNASKEDLEECIGKKAEAIIKLRDKTV